MTPSIEDVKKADAHYKLGISFFIKEQLQEASIEFQKAIKLNPQHHESYHLLGYISTKFKKYDDAISYYKRAISIDPDYSGAMNNLGVAYLEIENWDEAITYFKMALRNPLYETPEKAYSNMGYAYYRKGDYPSAVNAIKEAIVRYPEGFPQPDYNPNYVLGLSYMKLGNTKAAIDEFKKALDIAPKNIDVHWELADAYLKAGDKEKAVKHFKIVSESSDSEKSKKALEYIELLKE